MDSQDNPDNLAPPDLKVRYSDFSLLGAGGMGRVISAQDNHLNRAVAIKLLPRNSENALAVMRFQQEAKAVSKLNNPHIVQVLDFGYTEAGEPFLVMEKVTGSTLEAIIEKRERLPITEALSIAEQLCVALEHAHANDVVHRDLKPGNVMIDSSNSVRILDFGLARIIGMDEADWRLTRPGQPVGSILYMSPEQVRGEEADERSDVYSLALLILKMVSGELPYEGLSVLEIVTKRLEEEPPAVPELDDNTPLLDALNDVLHKALSLRPEDRHKSMKEFRSALLHVPDVAAGTSRSATATGAHSIVPGERKPKFILVALLAIVLVSSIVVAYISLQPKNEPPKQHKKHVVRLSDPKFIRSRDEMIKQKFLMGGIQDQPVWFADSTVTDDDLHMLTGLQVTGMRFEGNHNITTKGMEFLSTFPIRILALRATDIDDNSIPFINKMKDLWYLDVDESKIMNKGILQLSPSLRLTHLDMKKVNDLSEEAIRYIVETYPDINYLNISSTPITPEGIKLISKLRKLRLLNCAANKITDAEVSVLAELPSIESMDLSNNPITDKSFALFKKMAKLKHIDVTYCPYITDKAFEAWKKSSNVSAKGRKDQPDATEFAPLIRDDDPL